MRVQRSVELELEQVTGALELLAMARAQQSVRADLGEAGGKDVLQEAANERIDRKCLTPVLGGPRVDIAEGDTLVLDAFDAVVGERDFIDVA